MYKSLIVISICINLSFVAFAQTGNSPYSSIGLGDLYPSYTIPANGMGNVGLSIFSYSRINYTNPAFLPYNPFTCFEFGLNAEAKKLQKQESKQQQTTGNLNYVLLGIPVISKKYNITIGLTPISQVNYASSYTKTLAQGDLIKYSTNGNGGLFSFLLSQGVELSKNFSVGLQTSYLFGNITKSSSVENASNVGYGVGVNRELNYRGFLFKPGIGFRSKIKNEKFIGIGATYEFSTPISVRENLITQQKDPANGTATSDTLFQNTRSFIYYPVGFSAGISIGKETKWVLAADFSFQKWTNLQLNEDGEFLKNKYSIGIGGELTPDATDVSNYLNRVTYRCGINFTQTPIFIENKQINDYSVSVGASFPVVRFSYLNMAMSVGRRGTLVNNLVQETYFRFSVGITFNDRWFIRKKYE